MSTAQALKALEAMPEGDFQKFFETLPARVRLLVRGNMSNWREVLPQWYIKSQSNEPEEPINADDIPF